MKKMKRRSISLIVLSALIVSLAASCGDGKTSEDTTDGFGSGTTESTEQATTRNEPDFPDIRYDKEEILFLTESDELYMCREIFAETANGELINDAVYNRNLKVEERFGVEIAEERVSGASGVARKTIMSGDDVYDVVMPYMNDSVKNALEGLYMNLYDVENLNLDNPWWDQRANADLTVGGNLYFTTGDISILDNECTMVLFFNKQLIEDNSLDSPYDLVKNGTWTMDKLFAMCDVVASDLNGDTEMDIENDRFGLFSAENVPHSFWFGSGERISTTDKDGTLKLTMGTERSSEIIPYILENCQKSSVAKTYDLMIDGFKASVSAFMDGRILYSGWALMDINYIRDCKFDFGILPYPKYDENQSDYYNLISTIRVPGVSIPMTNAEPEKAGLILEAMAYYSVDTLTTAYKYNALNTRYIRDEESSDMLDIIFSTRVYDIGYISDVGGLGWLIWNMFTHKQTNFTSNYKSLETKAETALDKLEDSFNKAAEAQK